MDEHSVKNFKVELAENGYILISVKRVKGPNEKYPVHTEKTLTEVLDKLAEFLNTQI